MNIIKLELENICGCKYALLEFSSNIKKSPLYLVHSNQKCEIITLALQLICGNKYSSLSALNKIRDKVSNGKVTLTFTLPKPTPQNESDNKSEQQVDVSSESDEPCISRLSRKSLEHHLKRKRERERQRIILVKACRDFSLNPDLIVYDVDGGSTIECSVKMFQVRFFSCTDVVLPRLANITYGEYCNGKWLDLLYNNSIDEKSNDLITQFCQLYWERKISGNHDLSKITTSVLTALSSLNRARISYLINILNDIRCMFEYMTCSEFTVWFLLPSVFGNLEDINKITTDNVNFDKMETEIQLKQPNAIPFPWTRAEKHLQELLLVAVQLAFGYHSKQNIIYLQGLHSLEKHQSFEFFQYSLIKSFNSRQVLMEKNYFNRIFNVCAKLNTCCVLEYCGGLPYYPRQAFIIDCNLLDSSQEWQISVKDNSAKSTINVNTGNNVLQHLKERLK